MTKHIFFIFLFFTFFISSQNIHASGGPTAQMRMDILANKKTICLSTKPGYGSHKSGISLEEFNNAILAIVEEVFSIDKTLTIKSSLECREIENKAELVFFDFKMSSYEDMLTNGKKIQTAAIVLTIRSKDPEYVTTQNDFVLPFVIDGSKDQILDKIKLAATAYIGHLPSYFRCARERAAGNKCQIYYPFSVGVRDIGEEQ